MNKNELIRKVAKDADITNAAAAKAVDAVFDAISSALRAQQDCRITGFGTFTVTQRAARMGRNPRTGAPLQISPSRVPRFRASAGLRATLAGDPTTDF